MAIVTGVLADFGRGALANSSHNLHPQIDFIPSGNAVKAPNVLYATRTISTIPEISTGRWSVDLEDNSILNPETWYDVAITWLDAGGNYVAKDFTGFRLVVPSIGGDFADLVNTPSNPGRVWISLLPPSYPTPGTWWFKTNPDDVNDPANTGLIYELEA